MTGPSQPPNPDPRYRPPVARGQSYPPLGFADDGTPRFRYEAPTPAAALPEPPVAPPPGPPAPEPPTNDPVRRAVLGVAGVIVVVLLIAGGLKLFSGSDGADESFARRGAPPISQPTDDPYLQDLEDPNPQTATPQTTTPQTTTPRTVPPRTSRPPGPAGPPVEALYEVTTDGRATVVYRDGTQSKVVRTEGGTWSARVTANGTPHLTVLLADGGRGACTITVEGEVVADEELGDQEGAVRLLVCRG